MFLTFLTLREVEEEREREERERERERERKLRRVWMKEGTID